MRRRRGAAMLALAACAAAPALGPAPAGAQQVRVERRGASDPALDRRLDRLLSADPLIVAADTAFGPADTIRGSVLVLDATLIHEGVIEGDLVLVDAGAFVRPRSVVRGDLVNIGGGLYRSEIARVGGAILDLPTATYRVDREPDRLVIVATDAPSPLELDGYWGLRAPTYDRVNGVTAVWGARYWVPVPGAVRPYVSGYGGWRTEPGEPVYGGEAGLRVGVYTVAGGYDRISATNDDWIRGDLMNSLNYLWSGRDYRDYNEVERVWAGIDRELGDQDKSLHAVLGLRFQVEDATTLPGDDPWHLLGDTVRSNPPIEDGRTTSVVADLELRWDGLETAFEGGVAYERALDALDADFTFDRLTFDGELALHAFADHTLEVELHAQTPLAGDPMPPQRWSFVGGSGTLQTLEFAQYRGDHVVYVESKYIIPLPERWALPVLGSPDLELVHAAGMAWVADASRSFHQEIGARVRFFALYFRYMLEPEDPSNADLDIGLSWPFDPVRPWQR